MTKARIIEATKSKPVAKGKGIFEVKLISEGWGSSGYYSREMLETSGIKAFTKNTLSYANHSSQEELEKGRDITKIIGKYIEDAEGREDEDGKYALYAPLKVREEWIDFVDDFKESIGASIFISGEAVEGEAEGRSGMLVESLDADDPYKSVDLVAAAGRGGKVERMLEAYKATEQMTNNVKAQALSKAANALYDGYVWVEDWTDDVIYVNTDEKVFSIPYSMDGNVVTLESSGAIEVRREVQYTPIQTSEKEEKMADKDIEALGAKFDALAESLAAAIEALKPAPVEEDEVDRATVVESALKAGLGEKARKRVLEAVAAGTKPEDAIKAEQDIRDEILAEATDENSGDGRIRESAGKALSLDEFDF